jgi:branched-chain amino acid transport system permease protein
VFKYSKVGVAMQASSQNQLAAYYMGIPVKTLNGLVWGLAAGVAAIAGLLLAPITFVHANMGFVGLKAFPAAVVGGFGSLPGPSWAGWSSAGRVDGRLLCARRLEGHRALHRGAGDVVVKPNGLFGSTMRKKV